MRPRSWCRAECDATCFVSSNGRSLELAFRFRPIVTERVELRDLMQESLLGGDRHDGPPVGQKDRLTQLKIPIADHELLALEGGEGEIGPFDKLEDRLRIRG